MHSLWWGRTSYLDHILPPAVDVAALEAAGIDLINTTSPDISVSVDFATSLGGVSFVSGNTVILSDTGANIGAMTDAQIGALGGAVFLAILITSKSFVDFSNIVQCFTMTDKVQCSLTMQ